MTLDGSPETAPPPLRVDRPLLALGWMALSALGFATMSTLVKILGTRVQMAEMLFVRSAINFVLVWVGLLTWSRWRRKKPPEFFPRRYLPLLLARGLAGMGGLTCLFYAIRTLPLSIASLLGWCAPLFTILFSAIFSGERLSQRQLFWIAVAFAALLGVLWVPGTAAVHGVPALPISSIFVGLTGAAFGGLAYTAVRAATRVVDANVIVLYFVGVASLLSAPWAIAQWSWPAPSDLVLLCTAGVGATLGQVTMTQAYRYAPAGVASTMNLMTAIGTLLMAWAVLGERLFASQWLSMAVLILAITLLSVSKRRARMGG